MAAKLTNAISRYLKKKQIPEEADPNAPHIFINEAVGAIAFYYEKIRNVVDYQDEHLIRQNAIKRILNRRFIFEQSHDKIALALLKELVRSRYFTNNSIPEAKVREIRKILDLYLGVIVNLKQRKILSDRDQGWLLSMAACAIDENLSPMTEQEALVQLMYDMVEPQVDLSALKVDDKTKKSQVYLSAYKVIIKPDITRLRYFLLKYAFPQWSQVPDDVDIEKMSRDFKEVAKRIEQYIKNPLNKRLTNVLKQYRIPFIVLHTILKNNNESILEQPQDLEKEVKRICEGFYQVQKRRLYSRTVRAFVYIFLTKMVLGMGVELPYDIITTRTISGTPLLINILFPPILLALITLTAKFPKQNNTDRINQAIKEMVYPETERMVFMPQRYKDNKPSFILSFIFSLLYLALFAVSFGLVAKVLQYFHFNIVSGIVFFVFFCLITFFGLSLRNSVKDLIIVKPKSNVAISFLDPFFLPIIQVGRWLSSGISRVNIFIFIFDVLIEIPFQALIEITEEWFAFVKEKKEDIE